MAKSRPVEVSRAVRQFSGKTRKITATVQPEFAHRLRLYALHVGRDLGDVIQEGVMPLLSGFTVSMRQTDQAAAADGPPAPAPGDDGRGLRVA